MYLIGQICTSMIFSSLQLSIFLWERNRLQNISHPYLPRLLIQLSASPSWGVCRMVCAVPPSAKKNRSGALKPKAAKFCLPCPEQVLPSCRGKGVCSYSDRRYWSNREVMSLQTAQEICGGAKNRTEALCSFFLPCVSTTRPFFFFLAINVTCDVTAIRASRGSATLWWAAILLQTGDQIFLHKCSANLWKLNWGLHILITTMITARCGPSQNCWTNRQTAQTPNLPVCPASSRNPTCHVEKGNAEAKDLTVPQSQQNKVGTLRNSNNRQKPWSIEDACWQCCDFNS